MKTALCLTILMCVMALAFLVSPWGARTRSPSAAGDQIGTIQHRSITESSGIIASRKYPGVFWTHNDQGNDPVIYAITRDGQPIAEFRIAAQNVDWEDIATDDSGHLYIGNIGNNGSKRKNLEVLRIDEPDPANPAAVAQPIKADKTWTLSFPDKPFNCESLFIYKSNGYVISKMLKRQPASLYAFPLETDEPTVLLQEIATLPLDSPVTAADISADGSHIAVVSLKSLDVYRIDGDPAQAGRSLVKRIEFIRPHDIEACCFVPGGILATAETRQIYLYKDDRPLTAITPVAPDAAPTAIR